MPPADEEPLSTAARQQAAKPSYLSLKGREEMTYVRNRPNAATNPAHIGYFFNPSTLQIPAPRVAINRNMKQ